MDPTRARYAVFAAFLGVVPFACQPATPPPRAAAPAHTSAPAPPSSSPTVTSEPEENDGVLVSDDTRYAVERGGVELVDDGHAVFRDSKSRLRIRDLVPADVRGGERDPVRLALGQRASFGDWEIRWIAVREGLVRFEARFRKKPSGQVSAAVDPRMATHELRSSDKLFTFELRLVATHGQVDRADGRVDISGRATDVAPTATFGQKLAPGVFSFPDGLRIHVEQTSACDFDVSVPCPFGGNYRAYAALGRQEAQVELKSRVTKILGHTLELGRNGFVVRK